MRTIQTTDGYEVIVDDDDYDSVCDIIRHTICPKKYNRYAFVYLSATDKYSSELVLLHRYLMDPPDGMQVDHINGNGLDCRRSNMRVVTNHQNCLNRMHDFPRDPDKTPYVGVYYKPMGPNDRTERPRPWYCELKVCGKKYRRMYFRTAEEANMARNDMISQYITVL